MSQENEVSKKRSLPLRILFKILRIFLIWLPLSIIVLIAIVLFALKLYLTPERVENLIITNFNNMSNGEISLSVKDFSPYSGFEIDNILIKNGEEYGRSTFVTMEKLVVRYGLFSMLIGNIRIPEIGIYKPRIYLVERNGVWNAARLMKPGEKKIEEEEKEEEKPDEGPPPKEINLPISVEFLFKFVLDDLRLYVKGSSFNAAVEGLTFNIDIWIPPFKRIPTSVEAVSLLERMKIELNPKEEMNVTFSSRDASIKPPLIVTWKLDFNKKDKGKPQFFSRFKFGTYKTPVRFKRSHLAPLSFMVSYDIFYNPLDDHLKLNHFGISFKNKKWIYLAGSVKNVTKKQEFYIKMTESGIVLDDLHPYFRSITGDRRTKFKGVLSLFPLTIQGNPDTIDIDGAVQLKNIYFKNPDVEARIPYFRLSYSVLKRGNNMKILSRLNMPHLFYALARKKSGDNGMYMNVDISAFNNFQKVDINKFIFRFYNPVSKKNALNLAILGSVYLKPVLQGTVKIKRFTFLKEPLLGMVTKDIRKALAGVPLNKPLDMDLNVNFSLGKKIVKAVLGINIKVPDFDMNDLKLRVNLVQDNIRKRVTLNSFYIGAPSKGLSIKAHGTVDLKKPPMSDSDLKLVIELNSPKMKPIYGPWKLKGLFQLNTFVKGDLKTGKAYGNIRIDKLFVQNDESKMTVEDLNMAFPFEYYFTPQYKGGSRIAVNKTQVIDNENFKEKENFTIRAIKAKHPSRDISFTYLKDFGATMFFRNNIFEIVKLKAYILDGALYGRDILFNLADMKPENIEFRLILDVTNIDIGKLDEPDPAKKKRDAELSLNANFSGRDIRMFVGKSKELSVSGYINIHKIGEKFANRLMKGLSEEQGESKLGIVQPIVDNSMLVKGFNFNLDKGLIYATVTLSRRAVGFIATVKDEKVQFERMPIQVYLNNILGGK